MQVVEVVRALEHHSTSLGTADRLARTLGTTQSTMLAEVEREERVRSAHGIVNLVDMANDLIRSEYGNIVRSALTRAKNVGGLGHAGLTGEAREVFVQQMLRPILPPYVELGSGQMVDSQNHVSAQTDVVIYCRQTLPPLVFKDGLGVYPAEACIYAIEVKSRLTRHELSTTIDKFRRLKEFEYLPVATDASFQPYGGPTPPVIPMLFAYDTDLTTKGELERYRELDPGADTNPAVPVFCVVGRGYWWFQPREPAEKWIKHLPTDNHEEVVELIGGIANTIPDQIAAKGRPRFGNYLINPRDFEKH